MTKKERVKAVLGHLPVDRLPSQINYTGSMGKKIAGYLNISSEELETRLDNHLLRVDIGYRKRYSSDGSIVYDWWGAGFDTREEGYLVRDYPLRENDNVDAYPWPDPAEPSLLDDAASICKEDRGEHFIIPNFGFALFERAWSLRGMEQFLMDMVLEPGFTEDLLERITVIQIELAHRFVELGVDGGYFGDDLGAQKGLLFAPETWRRMFKPRLKRMFSVFRDRGLPVIMHSDGDIKPIIPDLIEIGLSALNPCQPEILDHGWLKREYGKDLCFYGGVSTQQTLPHGSPEAVLREGKLCIDTLASDSTG